MNNIVELCKAIYSKDRFLENEVRQTTNDLSVAHGRYDYGHCLVFRGTASIGGWLLDMDVDLVRDPLFPGQVHAGFLKGFKELYPFFHNLPIDFVTGHSLGGAIATLVAHHFQLPCYTFGCPRVGDGEFARGFKGKSFRYVNDRDPVPHVPALFYKHVDDPIKLNIGWWSWLPFRDVIRDHFIDSYVRAYG